MSRRWFVGIVISAAVIPSGAWPQQTLQELDTVSQFQRAIVAVEAIKTRKKVQCVLAIGSRPLCDCLSRHLPVDTYPRSYASIAKQENEYEQLSAADKTIVKQCVSGGR